MESDPRGLDRAWRLYASLAIVGFLGVGVLFGIVILPVVQGQAAGLSPWAAICRAIGLQPGAPSAPQPPSAAVAQPVSHVAWRSDILNELAHADPADGQAIAANTCSACHGDGGVSPDPTYPFLAGQSAAAIYKQLHDYASGARVHPLMTPVAKGLTEKQMADVAAYFARNNTFGSLGPRWPIPDDRTDILVRRGDPHRTLPGCNACHGGGVGGPIETPTLVGQHEEYIARQLRLFATGERHNDVYGRMRIIAGKLSDAEIAAVAHYYQGIR